MNERSAPEWLTGSWGPRVKVGRRGLDEAGRRGSAGFKVPSCSWEGDTDRTVLSGVSGRGGTGWVRVRRMGSQGSVLGRWHRGLMTGIRCLVDRWAPR